MLAQSKQRQAHVRRSRKIDSTTDSQSLATQNLHRAIWHSVPSGWNAKEPEGNLEEIWRTPTWLRNPKANRTSVSHRAHFVDEAQKNRIANETKRVRNSAIQ